MKCFERGGGGGSIFVSMGNIFYCGLKTVWVKMRNTTMAE